MRYPIVLAILSAICQLSLAQTIQPSVSNGAAVDAVGTEFTIFFQENAARRADYTFELQLFLTTHNPSPVTVQVQLPLLLDGGAEMQQEVIVRKGSVTEVNLPQTMMHIGSSISNKGIHILANAPIVVYGVNPQRFSSEGFIAIPNHLLGTEYYAVGMPAEDQHSQLGAVAVEGGVTEVTVTLPDVLGLKVDFDGRSYGANGVIVTTLNQYQTVQLQHRNTRRGVPEGDLSGARIQCTKRCAAFSGNSRTSVSGDSRDLLVEQLPPVSTWGREFAVPPTPERTDRPDILKIVCQQPGTIVFVDGAPFQCDAGGSIQREISTASPHFVTATKPVMAATVVMSQNGNDALIQADPAMTLIIPEEQYAQSYTIATATWSGAATDGQAYNNFLTVVIRRDRIDSVILDGVNVNTAYPDTMWKNVPSTAVGGKPPLVTAYFNITSGTHTISTLLDDTRFMCIVYGAGDRESYAYMGGMRLQVINPACTQVLQLPSAYGDGIDNDCDARIDEEFCDGEDDDQDGSIDEDCAVRNAVIAQGDVDVFVGETATLSWTVYATDYTSFNQLKLYKQQATATEVLVAEGNRSLELTQLFADTGRYSVQVSNAIKKGELDVVQVQLTITGARTVDPGDYRLEYSAQNGMFDDVNKLSVQQRNQHYEIIATDLETGSSQYARSTQPAPRNIYLQEGKDYSLTFQSIGGQHLDDIPYRQFLGNVEVTGDFEVIGLKEQYVTGSVTGLQDVKTVYELFLSRWRAEAVHDQQTLRVENADMTTVDSAVLNIDSSLVRPSISCRFELNAGNDSGRVVCDITNVKVALTELYWTYDGNIQLISPATSGPYSTAHSASSSNNEVYTAVFDGIKPEQWPDNSDTRSFQVTLVQSNGYTLSATTDVRLSQFPDNSQPGIVDGVVSTDYLNGVATIDAVVRGGGPPPNTFQWTVQQNDGSFLTYAAGEGDSTNVVINGDGHPTSTLTVNGLSVPKTHTFTASYVSNGNTVWTSYKTWALQPFQPVAPTAGQVTGNVTENTDGTLTLAATVIGGTPAADTFNWTLPDGSVLLPGESQGSYVASGPFDYYGNGSLTFYLTIPRTNQPQTIVFRVAAGQSWSGYYTYNIATNSPPSVACSLRTTNIRVGDEVELVCTVQPTPTQGLTYAINNLFYTNIAANGAETNISSTQSHNLFRYEQKNNSDGTITASLFFTLTEDYADIKDYQFTVEYDGGVIVTDIRLNDVLRGIANRPATTYVVGIESQMVTLTCNVQAGGSNSFVGLTWNRKSLGSSGQVQTVYENEEIQEPFKGSGRYIQSNTVTPDGFLQSTLKITNLQRTDIAEYSCVWGTGGVYGEFLLDVIGSTFIIDNQLFNGQLTPISDSSLYTLQFEFESVHITDYLVKYGGLVEVLTETSRNGTRYDSFAQENVPVQVVTLIDDAFSPDGVFVVQTYYQNSRSDTPQQEIKIADYVLTKRSSTSNQSDSTTFVYAKIDNSEYGVDENLLVTSGLPVSLSIRVSAPTCSQEIRIIVGGRDVTSEFTRTEEISGSKCTITLTRTNYIGNNDNGATIQTVVVTGSGNVILSENIITIQNPPPTTTPTPLTNYTDSCSDRNGGCHHRCVTDSATTFHCECEQGYTLQADGRVCIDNNECLVSNGGCDYICNNIQGSYTCGCPVGLRLSANTRSCIDDDECQGNPCLSTETCVNTFGSYHCIANCDCSCCDTTPTTGRKKRSTENKRDWKLQLHVR